MSSERDLEPAGGSGVIDQIEVDALLKIILPMEVFTETGRSVKVIKEQHASSETVTKNRIHLKCTYCDYQAPSASNLLIHGRTHTGEKPFKCDKCFRKFSRKGNLDRHKLHAHHGIRRFQCEFCGHKALSAYMALLHTASLTQGRDPTNATCVSTQQLGELFLLCTIKSLILVKYVRTRRVDKGKLMIASAPTQGLNPLLAKNVTL